eukprot:2364131-Prymnesium_polylepis.1
MSGFVLRSRVGFETKMEVLAASGCSIVSVSPSLLLPRSSSGSAAGLRPIAFAFGGGGTLPAVVGRAVPRASDAFGRCAPAPPPCGVARAPRAVAFC